MEYEQLASFFDELEKIASQVEDDDYITKEKLKRLGMVLIPVGLGSGLGYATGSLINRWLSDPNKGYKKFLEFSARHPTASKLLMKGMPAVLGASGGLIAGLEYLKAKKVEDYIRGRK